jgi:3-hydroxyacyl-[acyl-carrier-protein] dehydratase
MLDIKKIFEILPHRYPFLLVDRVVEANLEEQTILAQKNVTINEPFFNGHFPEAPIMPGVLLLEALAQTGGILAHLLEKNQGKIAVLLKIDEAKFRSPVKPGDIVHLYCKMAHITTKAGKMHGEARVGDRVAASGIISFAFVEKSQV